MKRSTVVWGFFLLFGHLISSAQAILDTKLANMNDLEERAVFIKLFSETDISQAKNIKGKENKTQFVFERKTAISLKSQKEILSHLDIEGKSYKSFYIVNGIAATLTKKQIIKILTFPEVEMIMEDGLFVKQEVETMKSDERTVEWGINKINARQVWALGFKGQNVVVGGQDTGYKWDHVQLRDKYRGWNGVSATHNYHWHDAIYQNNPMNSGTNPCGYNLSVPCDDNNHGTHTMGTMVGNHNTDTIGVAPDAKWIGCRNMERGYGSLTTYVECFEWFLAPYAYGDSPSEGDPTKMPHVINNSWGCPSIEGCNALNIGVMEDALMTLRLAGCVIVVSNGNSGSGCATTYDPPAFFEGSFSVGATNNSNAIAGFSSRGPVTFDNSNRLKPNVSAPGVGVRSSIANGGYATYNGTSMAGPHVAGAVALIISANPNLAGEVDQIEDILEQTTLPLTGGNVCGAIPTTAIPNNTFGYGLIDVQKAVTRARNEFFVPIIKTDQFGYRPADKKIAILSNPITGFNQADSYLPGSSVALKNAFTHAVVYSAPPVSWNSGSTHSQSGDQVWWFDFSNITAPGKYYVADGAVRSEDFIIHDTVYNELFKTAFKTFYYQRCGVAKTAPYVLPGYADVVCHAQDVTCKWYNNPSLSSRWKDLSGGWHDAGDYNKYVNFAYAAVFDLLMSFHLHQQAWVSDEMNIPESGNGIPDLLDEIKYETDWLLKMQENDGGVLCVVGVTNFATASPPSADNADRLYGPKTTSASYSAAAMFAFAATQFRKS
ncbi:MAG: S8 family serine peptidase [Saprospiraceae bacterium]|nr:S8 family serine peptidase [Saprospiraceae bacterium]